jgi:tetratricopeptide (TPR) repeat protein
MRILWMGLLLGAGFCTQALAEPQEDWPACTTNNDQAAIAACTRLIESGQLTVEESSRAFHHRGRAYRSTLKFDRAIADYNEAVRLKPDYGDALLDRADAFIGKNELDRAIADYSEAIRLKPDNAAAFFNRGLAYVMNREGNRAIADYDEAIRLNPDYADAFYARGNSFVRQHEYDRAIADYDEAIRLKPDHVNVFNARGRAMTGKAPMSAPSSTSTRRFV